jgi:hypothetical protein
MPSGGPSGQSPGNRMMSGGGFMSILSPISKDTQSNDAALFAFIAIPQGAGFEFVNREKIPSS